MCLLMLRIPIPIPIPIPILITALKRGRVRIHLLVDILMHIIMVRCFSIILFLAVRYAMSSS